LSKDIKKIAEVVSKTALEGDLTAARLVMERLIPPMKSRVVRFSMPKIESVDDIAGAMQALWAAVSTGAITIDEMLALTAVLEKHGTIIHASERRSALSPLRLQRPRSSNTGINHNENLTYRFESCQPSGSRRTHRLWQLGGRLERRAYLGDPHAVTEEQGRAAGDSILRQLELTAERLRAQPGYAPPTEKQLEGAKMGFIEALERHREEWAKVEAFTAQVERERAERAVS
jgi:hypothetical protein